MANVYFPNVGAQGEYFVEVRATQAQDFVRLNVYAVDADHAWMAWTAAARKRGLKVPKFPDMWWRALNHPINGTNGRSAHLAIFLAHADAALPGTWAAERQGYKAVIATGEIKSGMVERVAHVVNKLEAIRNAAAPVGLVAPLFVAPKVCYNDWAEWVDQGRNSNSSQKDSGREVRHYFLSDSSGPLPRHDSDFLTVVWVDGPDLALLLDCLSGHRRRHPKLLTLTLAVAVLALGLGGWHSDEDLWDSRCPGTQVLRKNLGEITVFPDTCRATYLRAQIQREQHAIAIAYYTPRATNAILPRDAGYLDVVVKPKLQQNYPSEQVSAILAAMSDRARLLDDILSETDVPVTVIFSADALLREADDAPAVVVIPKYRRLLELAENGRIRVVIYEAGTESSPSFALLTGPTETWVAQAPQGQLSTHGPLGHHLTSRPEDVSWALARVEAMQRSQDATEGAQMLRQMVDDMARGLNEQPSPRPLPPQ